MLFGKHVNRYYLRYGYLLIIGMLSLILIDYFQLEVPELYRMTINGMNGLPVEYKGEMVPFSKEVLLDGICINMVKILVAMVLGRFLWRICFFTFAIRSSNDIRNRMFERCKDLSHEYYQVNKVGNLMSLFTNDLDTVHECLADGFLMFFDALFLGLLAVYKMWLMDHLLTFLSLIPMALMMVIGTILGKSMRKKWAARQKAFSAMSDFSQECFSGIAVVKAFVKEWKECLAFRKLNRHNEEVSVDHIKTANLLNILTTLLVESVVCVILGYGGYLVYLKKFDAGQLVEYIGYFTAMVWPVMAVSMLIEKTSRGKASLIRVSELLDAKIDVRDREGVQTLEQIQGRIEFRDLTFRYPDGEFDAISHASFVIEAGENVGLVGKTGSGKTTLVDLIVRIFNVPDGTLFIDGHDVNTVSIRSVRDGCAYVPQDNFLFSDTIENNIAFAFDEADPDAVMEAAKQSNVHSNIIQFQEKYKTVLGERGVTVSGGQKQRISIARALLKNSPILILDDSVSAVDTSTEQIILKNLRETRAGRTTILIAHRITTIQNMDKIIFIDDGKIVAVGSHDQLYATCPEYRNMVDLQRLEDEKEVGAHA